MNLARVERLYATLLRDEGPDPVLLLGAGASIKSGIPLSGQIVERAAKWAYCQAHGRKVIDPAVHRSDWLPWLESHPWYRPDAGTFGNYSAVIENLLQPRQDRKDFLLEMLNPGVPASAGYEHLVDLLADNIVRTILTPNFDSVLPDLCRMRQRPHYLEIVKTPADYTKISTIPRNPQLIYLHGAVENYSDRNLTQETQRLDGQLLPIVIPFLRDHPVVVIGYRGAEPSIMRHLFIEQATSAELFRHGVYWCARSGSVPDGLHPMVCELAELLGGNFQIVPIEGFDELMNDVWLLHQERLRSPVGVRPPADLTARETQPFDMRITEGAQLDDLNWTDAESRVVSYCRRMSITVPRRIDREWLLTELCALDLAVILKNNVVQVSNAGYLMFGREPQERLKSAKTVLRVFGELDQVIGGSIWSQLDAIMLALDEVNRPYRLKGMVSETVYPYSQLALKELMVNALAHRNYEEADAVTVEIASDFIRIVNPGGLVDEVVRLVRSLPLQEQIVRGARGIRGYRNPVIADLFYGAGAMDKAGSGLADVEKWVRENGGRVRFGPTDENQAFEVVVYRRPDAIDEATGTAVSQVKSERYSSNLLEIMSLPKVVWHVGSAAESVRDVWSLAGGDDLPPFILLSYRIYTFADLTDLANPIRQLVDKGDLEYMSVGDFSAGIDGQRHFVYLLNECLYRHLERCGLLVDKQRKRAYFPRTEAGPREVTYQARLRRATRTVTKPIVGKASKTVRYWEHEAVRFGFERFGESWALNLLPGYVFTVDGSRQLVEGRKVGALATRRASHDYNLQVRNDLVFWIWTLSQGLDAIFVDAGVGSQIIVRRESAMYEVRDTNSGANGIDVEVAALQDEEDEDLEEELSELADSVAEDLVEVDDVEA